MSARARCSWIAARSSRRRRARPSSIRRKRNALSASSSSSRSKKGDNDGTEGTSGNDRGSGADAGHLARRGAADAVAALRGDQEQEAPGLPVPPLLLDLVPQPEERQDRGHRRRSRGGARQG